MYKCLGPRTNAFTLNGSPWDSRAGTLHSECFLNAIGTEPVEEATFPSAKPATMHCKQMVLPNFGTFNEVPAPAI
jgi:hypothetical protein